MIGSSLTLRRALVLVVVFGMLLPALLINGYSWFQRYDEDLKKQTLELLQMNADILANGMQEPLWNINQESGGALLDAMMARNEDIIRIKVRDTALGVFVAGEHTERRLGFTASIERPVIYRGRTIGSVEIEVGSTRLRKLLIENLIAQMAALAAQVVLSIALILVLLEKRLVIPLQRLGKGAERLAGRELDTPFTWTNLDEIGLLSRRLEDTRISLRRLFEELDKKNQELEQDIEKRKKIEEAQRLSEAKFSGAFQCNPDSIAIARVSDGMIIDVNQTFERITGFRREEAIGKNAMELGLWTNPDERRLLAEQLKHDDIVRDYPWRMRTKYDDIRKCLTNATVFRIGTEHYMLAVIRDVTAQRLMESEIRELNATLEERVIERTNELQEANRELANTLETLNKAQEELVRSEKLAALGSLVAGIAHELNTPIGNSLMVASTLIDQTRALNGCYTSGNGLKRSALETYLADAGKAGDILVRNLHRAANLVTSFKQVAVDQTSSQRRTFALEEVVSEIILTLWPTLKKTAYAVEQHIPGHLLLDSYPGPLGQVVANLVNNALVHAFEGRQTGTVALDARAGDEGWVELIVKDDGIGISAANLNRIFDPFFTTKLGAGGSGLGLNITHNIVTGILGGRIRVQSEVGVGTTFVLALPTVAPAN